MRKEKLSKKNQSVEKAFQIIEIMAANRGPLRLNEIATRLGLPTSTVLRFLSTLMSFDYVNQDAQTLKYSLSLKFCHIGNLVSSQFDMREIVRPFLRELADRCNESVCLVIEENMMSAYIDVIDGPDSMLKTLYRIGKTAPLHSTGVGKNLLLNYDEAKLDDMIKKKGLNALTTNTITTKEGLLMELERVRAQGYALDNEECEIGVKCIAAPLKDYTGKVIASISVSGPISRMTMDKIGAIKDIIKDSALKISQELMYVK